MDERKFDNVDSCQGCRGGSGFTKPFSMAFQPIVDVSSGTIFAHEAVVRGPNGEGANTLLSAVKETNRCETLPSRRWRVTINFMPNAVYEPRACMKLTLEATTRTGFPLDRIIFEFTETEKFGVAHILTIVKTYKEIGFTTAIDDSGAGNAGLALLALPSTGHREDRRGSHSRH